jgi:hypothetical protein
MPRTLRPVTPLARLILDSGKPAYVVAAEVGINHSRLLDYANDRVEMSSNHILKLSDYFGVRISDLRDDSSADIAVSCAPDVSSEAQIEEPCIDFECTAMPVEVRAAHNRDVSVKFRVEASESAPWELVDASTTVNVWTIEWSRSDDGEREASWVRRCEALVDDVRASGGNLVVGLTVPRSDRDSAFEYFAPRRGMTGRVEPIDVRITSTHCS